MQILINTCIAAGLGALLLVFPFSSVTAAEIDFFCMSYKVWPKRHVSHRYREYDVVLENRCPGPVYWSMCIERINSASNNVWETHTPSGYVQPERKARVNLQMKRNEDAASFRQRYEEFYVNFGFAIDGVVAAECHAARCEASKRDLRAAIKANEKEWETAVNALNARIMEECPESGWDPAMREECVVEIRDSGVGPMAAYEAKDTELRGQMASIDPEHCTLWSGDLVTQ